MDSGRFAVMVREMLIGWRWERGGLKWPVGGLWVWEMVMG